MRDQRKKDLENHVAEVNALMKAQRDSDDEDAENEGEKEEEEDEVEEWQGFDDTLPVNGTDEYIDEGKYTTVTVKELDDIRDFESASEDGDKPAADVVVGVVLDLDAVRELGPGRDRLVVKLVHAGHEPLEDLPQRLAVVGHLHDRVSERERGEDLAARDRAHVDGGADTAAVDEGKVGRAAAVEAVLVHGARHFRQSRSYNRKNHF